MKLTKSQTEIMLVKGEEISLSVDSFEAEEKDYQVHHFKVNTVFEIEIE